MQVRAIVGLKLTSNTDNGFLAGHIGDVDEGVVEGGEDTGNAEDELAWRDMLLARGPGFCNFCVECRLS